MEKKIDYRIEGKQERIIEILTDLKLFGKVHPLICNVEKLESTKASTLYKITERPYSFLPIKVSYMAEVDSSDDEIKYTITGLPLTKAFLRYKFSRMKDSETVVHFHLKIESSVPGKSILFGKMIDAQNKVMEAIGKDKE